MQNFELDGLEYEAGSNSFLAKLPAAHEAKTRPLCLCSTPPIPMYIARFEGGIRSSVCPVPARSTSSAATRTKPRPA